MAEVTPFRRPGTPGGERIELIITNPPDEGGGGPPPTPPAGDDGPEPIFGTEDAMAVELVRQMSGDYLFASNGVWFQWDGKRYRPEKLRRVWNLSRQVCRRTARLLDDSSKTRAIKTETNAVAHAVVKFAETDPKVTIEVEAFDADPWLLNAQNCVIDLRSGQPRPHDRELLMTRCCGAAPIANTVKDGEIPHWKQFLRDCTGGDLALAAYLQRVAGYCLTGSVEEHAIFFLYGPGGTGKSTFQHVLSLLLADYATTAMQGLFTEAKGERHATELATLHGRRLVIGGEIDGRLHWDTAKLKAISGGDEISARFMRGDPFSFSPQFKLLLAGNYLPRLGAAEEGMKRRLQVIPFVHKPDAIDKALDEKLRAELPGILAWAVEGAVRWRLAGGLNPPKAVVAATDEYFLNENIIGRWIDERCALGRNQQAARRALYRDFQSWALGLGEHPMNQTNFSRRLKLIAGVQDRVGGVDVWVESKQRGFVGIGLRDGHADLLDGGPDNPTLDPAEDWPRE